VNESRPTTSVYSDPPHESVSQFSPTENCQFEEPPQPSCSIRCEISIVAQTPSVTRGRRESTCCTLAMLTSSAGRIEDDAVNLLSIRPTAASTSMSVWLSRYRVLIYAAIDSSRASFAGSSRTGRAALSLLRCDKPDAPCIARGCRPTAGL
jgi:hypothetical protein